MRTFVEAISRNRRPVLGALTVLALSAAVAVVVTAGAQSASASGSCVHARASVSHSTVYARARHNCSGSQKMYVFVQARYGRGARVYTLASGSTTGKFLKTGAPGCAFSGTWHTWTLATRGLVTSTSKVVTYSCTRSGLSSPRQA